MEATVNRVADREIPGVDALTVERRVIEICQTVLQDATITLEATPATVERWDSLGHMDLIAAIEAAFEVELDVEEMADVDSVRALVEVVQGTVSRRKG